MRFTWRPVTLPSADLLLLLPGGPAEPNAALDVVISEGSGGRRSLTERGYEVRRYRVTRTRSGIDVDLLHRRRRALHPDVTHGRGVARRSGRTLRARLASRTVLIATRSGGMPALVVEALTHGSVPPGLLVLRLRTGGDDRRRTVLFLGTGATTDCVIKVERGGSSSRGALEQQVLGRLGELGVSGVPRALGFGRFGSDAWSAESALPGRALASIDVRALPRQRFELMLEEVTSWFVRLAVASRGARQSATTCSLVGLRGEHTGAARRVRSLNGVPLIMAHGDVGSGVNLLLDGTDVGVIDWETALSAGLPLHDLLPLLCHSLALRRGLADPDAGGRYIVHLCAGKEPESPFLISLVLRYLRALDIDLRHAAALGALAWAHEASIRLVHDEMLVESGVVPSPWRTAADYVAPAWRDRDDLGTEWVALDSGGRG